MKTLHTTANGDRILLVTAEEWDGLSTAVDMTYQDEESVPEPLRPIAESLYRDFFRAPPLVEPVNDQHGIRVDNRTPAFVAEGVPFYPFPNHGCFLGVAIGAFAADMDMRNEEGDALLTVAMLADGSPETVDENIPDVVEVTNMSEDGDAAFLEDINEFFGTAFVLKDFAGR